MMIFGLAGASGTGKTTLGRHVGDALCIPFQPTSITGMAAKAGYNPVSHLLLQDRIDLQESMLKQMEEMLTAATGPVIFDRTPIDLVGYMLSEVYMHSANELSVADMKQIDSYVTRCQLLTSKYFEHVFVTGLLPEYELAETRPDFNPAYQRHVHTVIVGTLLTMKSDVAYSIFSTDSLTGRSNFMIQTIERNLNDVKNEKRHSGYLH